MAPTIGSGPRRSASSTMTMAIAARPTNSHGGEANMVGMVANAIRYSRRDPAPAR